MLRAFLLIIFFPVFINVQDLKVEARLNKNKALIGDQVQLEIRTEADPKVLFTWPLLKDSLGKLEIVSVGKTDTLSLQKDPVLKYKRTYLLTSFDTGYFAIPPISFNYRKQGDTGIFRTETQAMLLGIFAPKVDTTQAIRDIKGPKDLPYTFREFLPYGIGILALVAIIAGIIYFIRRKKNKPVQEVYVPPVPAHTLAIQALEELGKEKLWQQGKVKEYHSRLSDIIREYIEVRFRFGAMEMTSDEILKAIKNRIDNNRTDQLTHILHLADLAKFAKMQPVPVENELSLEYALSFVRSSIEESTTEPDKNVMP